MKNYLILLLTIVLTFTINCNVNDTTSEEEEMKIDLLKNRIVEPEDGIIDNFKNGIDCNKWKIVTRCWSSVSNGNLAENVGYTENGILVLQAHGLEYMDESKRNTGAVLVSTDTYGPGEYEICMRIIPRLGVCNAFWTFYYSNDSDNHEIDIELPGKKTYQNVLNTNWTGVNSGEYTSIAHKNIQPLNDNKWHTYKFQWKTDPKEITYYVDGQVTEVINQNVPTKEGNLWLGVWFPVGWCGEANFDTDYLLVDWVRYVPYSDQPYTKTNVKENGGTQEFPSTPIEMPELNVLGQREINGFYVPDEQYEKIIEEVFEGYKYELSLVGKGKGYAYIEFFDDEDNLLNTAYSIMCENEEFELYKKTIVAPSLSNKMKITLVSQSDFTIKNLKMIFI